MKADNQNPLISSGTARDASPLNDSVANAATPSTPDAANAQTPDEYINRSSDDRQAHHTTAQRSIGAVSSTKRCSNSPANANSHSVKAAKHRKARTNDDDDLNPAEASAKDSAVPPKRKKGRYLFVAFMMTLLFCALGGQLYKLQIEDGDKYISGVEDKTTKTRTVTGKRGAIMDVNSLPLAVDEKCYNVQFYRDPNRTSSADRAAYTQAIIDTIRIVEKNGGQTITEFWLKRNETTGAWEWNLGTANEESQKKREAQWRANFSLQVTAKNPNPLESLFDTLCTNYSIPAELSEDYKIKVLAIWQSSRMSNFLGLPVDIAYNVNLRTVAEIESSSALEGMSIIESTQRIYPRGEMASHIIGYIGKISNEEALAEYKEKGYSSDALVGITGIESSMEDQLTPYISYRQGTREVEVNNRGKTIRTLSNTDPIDGNNIMLTIDSKLQSKLEQALRENIALINAEQRRLYATDAWQEKNAKKLESTNGRELNFAETGAAVVMNPNTGEVLAMASEPGYNPNWFTSGVNSDEINALFQDERNPMFNRAISAKETPGSIFKMVTAMAGLMEKVITPTTLISDEGKYIGLDETHQPICWAYPYVQSHQDQDVVAGLKNSCNYFFYKVGEHLGSNNITKWAARFGLTSKTGIELPGEATSIVGNQETLYNSEKAITDQSTSKPRYAANKIRSLLEMVGEEMGIEYDEERLDRVVKALLDIVNEEGRKDKWPARIRTILLQEMNLTNDFIARRALGTTIMSYLNDLKWTDAETIMCAIGQSITQITPIAAARYISAVANGGTVYDAQIIDKIVSPTGEVILDKDSVVASYIDDPNGYFEYIRQGMHEVTSIEDGGTAGKYYNESKYKDVICAKTGTAQTGSLIDLENKSWHVAFAPMDDPQIVVVVYIPNGYAGGLSAYTCVQMIDYYLGRSELQTQDILPNSYSLAP